MNPMSGPDTGMPGREWETFVGREGELTQLRSWGERGGGIMVVSGPAGVGKTALALEYARRTVPYYERQVVVRAREFESARSVLPFVLSQMRTEAQTEESRPSLVILDGLDEMSDRWDEVHRLVISLLHAIPDARWLITSRSRTVSHVMPEPVPELSQLELSGMPDLDLVDYLLRDAKYRDHGAISAQQVMAVLSSRLLPKLTGAPLLWEAAVEAVLRHNNPEDAFRAIEAQVARDLTDLVVVWRQGAFRAAPTIQLPTQNLIIPQGGTLPATPYVLLGRLSVFWREPLAEFEAILNDPRSSEEAYQAFFERHPQFLRGVDYGRVLPHPLLETEQGDRLIPDFLLQIPGSSLADVLDLKLPEKALVVGRRNRLRFSAAVEEAVAQVREYRDYFDDPRQRERVAEKYGLTAYRPVVAVVIGRKPKGLDDVKLRQMRDSLPGHTRILTYDELFEKMQRLADIYGV